MESPTQIEAGQVDAAAMPLNVQAIKKIYMYSRLPKGNIRLLKLLPHRDIASPLQCGLIDYPLQDLAESNHHLYDSLSYTWGLPEKPQSISIGDCYLPITTNLHAALLRLRDRFLERIIWVDAICINQQDTNERSSQVQRMAMIYALANRVIVWLGEAEDNSDQAIEEICKSADGQPAKEKQKCENSVLKLLQRSWFKRIWILQEMAAARNVLIICGSSEIDGYIFCMGINSLNLDYADKSLQNLIRSATHLIRRRAPQPEQTGSNLSAFSMSIAPLSELIDIFHTREATDCRDKVYALLGMSSNNYNEGGLSPDYNVQWKMLFQQVIRLILCESVLVSTWQNKEVAVIKNKGYILGQVSSVETDATWSDKQNVTVSKYTTDWYRSYNDKVCWTLTLPTLAISIQKGDIICLLQGASKPTIIRPYDDYFLIVAIAISPTSEKHSEKANKSWVNVLQSVTDFPRDILLVWDWTKSLSGKIEDDTYPLSSQISKNEKTAQLMEKGLIMSDLKSYKRAVEILKWVTEKYIRDSKSDCSHTIAAVTNVAAAYKGLGLSKEERKWRVMADILSGSHGTERMVLDLLRSYDGEILKLLPNWSWGQVIIPEDVLMAAATAESKDIMEILLDHRGDQITITEKVLECAATTKSKDVLALLLDRGGDQITITEGILIAAAAAESKDVMELLLDRRGDQITITEKVLKFAVKESSKGVLALLLDHRSDQIAITEEMLKLAAANYNKYAMELLLDLRGDQITITEDIVKVAATEGSPVMELLLDRRGNEITITEDIIKAAVTEDPQLMMLLLDRRDDEITITEDIVKVAVIGNPRVMELLLDRRGDEITITEDIMKAAATGGSRMMELLLDRRGDEITITEGIMKAAATGSWLSREKIVELLLDRRGDQITITEDIIKAAAGSGGYASGEIIKLLLDRRGDEITITEDIFKAAVIGNPRVMMILLDRRGDEIKITEDIIKVAAAKRDKGLMRLLLEWRGD